ncbi:unnamed protein product [Diamesa tonsa]
MAQNLSGGKLIILKNDGITERIAYLPKNKRVINVGSDITCDIRLYLPEIRQFHFKITPDQIGKPKVSNLSVQNPITVNDEIVTTKRILKSGDVIGVLGKKFRWENKLDAKRKSAESLPGVKKSRKSIYTNCIATQRRITILSICQSEKKKYTDAVFEHTEHELQSNQLKKKLDKSNPLTTPTREIAKSSPLKKNNTSTPKTPNLDFLNRSETLITSYSVSKSFSTPTKSCMSSKISTPDSKNKHYNCSTPSKINLLKTPQNVLAEKSHNLIELHSTPVHGQKKSMHLIDLTTPFIKNSRQFTPKHVTSTPKLTEKNNVSTRKDNTLLKSAIKNSTVKKRWAVNGRSITLPSSTTKSDVKANSSTIAESPLYTSCRDSSSVIEVNETLDDTFETIPPSMNTECIEDTETISMVLSSQETNDTANSPGISNMLKFTQYQKTETRDVSGIIELVKTPTTHTSKVLNVILKTPKNLNEIMETSRNISSINAEQSDSDEDGVKELLSSISSVLEDSNEITKNETRSSEELPSNSIKFIPNEELSTDNPEFVVSEKVVSSIDVVPNNFIEPELKTMDRTFDELIGIPTITKTYNRKSSAFIQEKIDDESSNEMKLKEKECGERVIKWIEDVKASGSLECNNKSSVQIISARYSNVTPNDSLVESTSLNKTSDVTERSINVNNSPRLSILETIEHLKQVKLEDSQINQKLTMSPVARLSIMDNSTEVLENYHYHEMPNSLRSTRKKFGMAFASLHNVSAQAAEDLNESINNSMHSFNDGMKDGEESKSSSPNILSLDGYQQKDDLCGKENQAPLYQSYIEFVKTDDCDHGSDNEVFEISDSNQLIDESIESDQSSENEYEDDSSSEFDEFIEDSGRKMNDKISEDLFGINPIENSSDDDEKETDVLCSVSRIDEQLFENLKFIVDDSEDRLHKIKESEEMEIDSVSKSSETGEILHLSFSAVLGNSTEKESVIDQEDLLPSTFEVVGKKRTRGVKVNYLEMATGSSAKISTPHRNVESIEGTPRKSSRVAVLSKPAKSEIQLSPHGKKLKFSSKFEKDPKENDLEELIGAKKMIHINKVVDIPKKELAKKNNRKKVAIEHLTDQPTTESGETAKELIKKQTKKDSKIAVDKVRKALDETIKTDKIEVQSEIKSRRGKKIHDEIETQIRNGQIQTNQEETPINGVLTGGAVTSSVTEEQSVVIEEVGKPVRKGRVVAATKTKEIVSTDEFATPVKRGRKKVVSIETDAKIIEINSVATTNLIKETPKRGRKKTVKIVENELMHSEVALINEALTESIVDDNASETPRRGRRKLVKNVKKTDLIVTQREEVPAGELQIEVILAEQDPAIKDLCSIIPKRGRKETVKVETRSVVTKKKDIVVAELKQKEVTELDEYQIAENVAEKEPKMTDKLSTETPRRGRKKIVKNVETRSVVINKKDINETELKPQNLAVEPKIIEVEVAEKELASTEKLCSEKPFKGNEKTVNNVVTKSVATKTKDLVEVELQQKNVTVEDVKMEEQVAEQKSSTTNKLGRETPLRVRKKVVKNVEIKPVISKKADETETEQKNEPIEAAEKLATVGRAAKKRKSELEMETSITTDLIPKRRLRGTAAKDVVETHQKKDDQEIEVKDVTIDTKTVETNIRKRKIKPAAVEADINTIVKKSRAKATKKKNEELSADETMEVQKILVDNTESQPSKAKKVIVPTEVKRSTRRKN